MVTRKEKKKTNHIVFKGRSKCVEKRHSEIAFGWEQLSPTEQDQHVASRCLLGIRHHEGDICAFAWRSAGPLLHKAA